MQTDVDDGGPDDVQSSSTSPADASRRCCLARLSEDDETSRQACRGTRQVRYVANGRRATIDWRRRRVMI